MSSTVRVRRHQQVRPNCVSFFMILSGILLICGLATPVVAGQAQDATVFGQVTDDSGAVLPGVTVTVASPALQLKQIVAVTDARGEYRITPLPLGVYSVEFELPGFQKQKNEGLRLTAGFVAKVDVSLKVGGLEESVTVTGQSPVVDVKTTSAGTQVTQEVLESIPTARNSFNSLLTLAAGSRPEIDTGEVRGKDPVLKAFGRANNAWITIDGLAVTAPTEGSSGFQTAFNYTSVDEATVSTLASSAEAPTSGIQLNVITKSGSNSFHGSGFLADTLDWMQASNNLNDKLRSQGLTSSVQYDERWDSGGDLGGRVVRDKLWFYGSARIRQEAIGILGSVNADGSPAQFTTDQRFLSTKVTNQLTTSQRVVGSYHWRKQFRFNGPETRFHDVDTTRSTTYYTNQGVAQWQLVKSNKVLSIQGGGHHVLFPVAPQYTKNSSWQDEVTGLIGGLETKGGEKTDMGRWEGKTTLNYYKPDWGGNHDFTVGANYTLAHREAITVDRGDPVGNYTLIYRSGVPFSVVVKNAPVDPVSRLGYLGMYFQDSWTVKRRLTLNLGVRYANDRAWLPEQCRVAAPGPFAALFPAECFSKSKLTSWNTVVPRVHAAYDVTGNGKTVVKGGWGRFYNMHSQDELNPFNANAKKEATFLWRDLNANRRFDAGESALNFNGSDFVSLAIPGLGSLAGLVNNPDLKAPGSDEYSLSMERELAGNFGMRATGVYVHQFNTLRLLNTLRPYSVFTIPITNPDPGPDGRVGTSDDPGRTLTYYDYPASLRGVAFQRPMFVNHSPSDANFSSFEVALNKRFSKRWQMLASYSATKHDIPVPARAALDPNAEINAADGTWEWLFRGTGSYQLPAAIQISTNILVQSGNPWARTVSVRGGQQIPSITLNAERIGDHSNDRATAVALNAEKSFMVRGHKLSVGANVLNLFNANFETVTTPRSGATFGYATEVSPPRIGEVVLRYTF